MAPSYRWAIGVYDRAYRLLHRLDRPEAEVGPVLRVEVQRIGFERDLPDGSRLRRGEHIGVLHLNNDRLAALYGIDLRPISLGLAFRRQLIASLQALAVQTLDGPLAELRAFAAVTIFHRKLMRLGFAPDPQQLAWPRLVGAYQRALLASLHPHGALRLRRLPCREAQRLWLTRSGLLEHYGPDGAASPLRLRPEVDVGDCVHSG